MSSRDPTTPGINATVPIISLWPQLGAASWGPCPSDLKPQMEFHCESEPEFASRPPQRLTSKYRSGSVATEVPFARCNEGVLRRAALTVTDDKSQHLRLAAASGRMIADRQNYTVAANTNRMAALSAPMTASGMTSSGWLFIVPPALEFPWKAFDRPCGSEEPKILFCTTGTDPNWERHSFFGDAEPFSERCVRRGSGVRNF
jgi:hypothetical protein